MTGLQGVAHRGTLCSLASAATSHKGALRHAPTRHLAAQRTHAQSSTPCSTTWPMKAVPLGCRCRRRSKRERWLCSMTAPCNAIGGAVLVQVHSPSTREIKNEGMSDIPNLILISTSHVLHCCRSIRTLPSSFLSTCTLLQPHHNRAAPYYGPTSLSPTQE